MVNEVSTNDLADKLLELTVFCASNGCRAKARSNRLWDMLKSWTSNRRMPLTTRRNHAEREEDFLGKPNEDMIHTLLQSTSAIGITVSKQNHNHRSSTDLHLLKLHLKHRIQNQVQERMECDDTPEWGELQPVEPTSTKAKEGGKSLERRLTY
ncbi:UNVERIFIED_CONTAM: hypothetical protein Slati_2094200 [Sesamum latifolium]|uniref:Uncharacterized protein n=1 Tax=Sesamum latifolium TaxID=2727402 RepID=A0AAW2WUF4_9LAMI